MNNEYINYANCDFSVYNHYQDGTWSLWDRYKTLGAAKRAANKNAKRSYLVKCTIYRGGMGAELCYSTEENNQ